VQTHSHILHCNRSPEVYTLVPIHRLLKKTRIRWRKLYFPSYDPHYPQQMRADRAYVPPRVSFSFVDAFLDVSPASICGFLQFSGNRGKQCCVLAGRNWEMDFLLHRPTNRASSAWDDTRQNPYQRVFYFPQIPNDARSNSSQFYQERHTVCQLLQLPSSTRAITPSSDWLVVVRHVEGMNRFVTSIYEVTLVVTLSRFGHWLLHFTSKRTHVNKPANRCC
jgi:hypothetical protein